jgi:hypothetical protein
MQGRLSWLPILGFAVAFGCSSDDTEAPSDVGGAGAAAGSGGSGAAGGQGGTGAVGGGGSGGAAGECSTEQDCRLFGSSCKTCTCIPLSAAEPEPVCDGEMVTCNENPCGLAVPKCELGQCVAR